ncbi:ABC transporter substrate-binding protein [Ornithinibacillus sp. 4-3]|uniref:ABC transporter substrate-binding protein n=1 Tax=Ornithinibacillus sp. 4-3 TaxID=3231488 RepID=A0AB39HP35_9BACI
MKFSKRSLFLVMLASIVFFIIGCSSNESEVDGNKSDETSNDEANTGSVLKIALDGQPPTLDQPTAAPTAIRDTARLMFETLLTTDSNYAAVPMLAESVETDDNKTYVFHLREGVLFHNGKEMIAEDVIASMERWLEKSAITGTIFEGATWTAEDNYTVVLELVESSSLTLDTIASSKQAAAIMPKEVVEAATAEGVSEYIGTGPYQFVEWRQDQYIHFTKFDDYSALEEPADGLAGKKEALVDDIYFYIVTDASTRIAGLQTGEYDFAYGVPYDSYEQVNRDENINTHLDVTGVQLLAYNKEKGPAADVRMREVINTALDIEEIMMAAYPNEDLFWLHSSYMDEDIVSWASDAGEEYHNINDPEKAKQMLEDMDYNGEEFKILATRDYDHHYNAAVVIHDQLSQIGINATLEIYDWPTVTQLKDDTDAFDAYVISFSTVSTPPQFLGLSPTWAGGVNDEKVVEDMKAIETAPTTEEAQEIWEDLQRYAWEELLPVTTFGSYNSLYASSNKVEGIITFSGPIFWNVTIGE